MKKFIGIVMVLVMLICVCAPAAYAATPCDCGFSPVIYLAGLGSSDITRDAGTPNEQRLWKIDTEYLISECSKLVPSVGMLFANGDWDAFGDDLIGIVNTVFGDLALDGDGNSADNITVETRTYDNPEHNVNTNYYFGYDFRISPIEVAAQLKEVVEHVKDITGHEKVSFRASSMGGVIALAYIAEYGSEDIDKLIFVNCPLLGTEVAGELFNKQLVIDKDALIRYGEQALPALDNDPLGGFLYVLIEVLEKGGVWEQLLSVADKLVENLGDRIFDEALIPIFGSMPGIWAFVSDLYFEDAKLVTNNPETQAGILAKINDYHYNVQCKAQELLDEAQSNGVRVYLLAGYDMQRTPLVPSFMNDSDGTVDTKYASLGATVAPLNEQLPDGYTQAVDFGGVNYISPDNHIDASTCMLPESTWFIKNMLHCNNHDGHGEFYRYLLSSDEQLTVFSNPDYPQFMQNDVVNQTFYEVVPDEDFTPVDSIQVSPSFITFAKILMNFLFNLESIIKAFS